MLAGNGVVFPDRHLVGHVAGILPGNVEMPGSSGGIEPDLDGCRLGHVQALLPTCPAMPDLNGYRDLSVRDLMSTNSLCLIVLLTI